MKVAVVVVLVVAVSVACARRAPVAHGDTVATSPVALYEAGRTLRCLNDIRDGFLKRRIYRRGVLANRGVGEFASPSLDARQALLVMFSYDVEYDSTASVGFYSTVARAKAAFRTLIPYIRARRLWGRPIGARWRSFLSQPRNVVVWWTSVPPKRTPIKPMHRTWLRGCIRGSA